MNSERNYQESELKSRTQGPHPEILSAQEELSLRELVGNLVFYRRFFFLTLLLFVALGFFITHIVKPTYNLDSLIKVEEKSNTTPVGALNQTQTAEYDITPAQGEIDIIRSRKVITDAVEMTQANVSISLDKPSLFSQSEWQKFKGINTLDKLLELFSFNDISNQVVIKSIIFHNKYFDGDLKLKVLNNNAWTIINENKELVAAGKTDGVEVQSYDGSFSLLIDRIDAPVGSVFDLKITPVLEKVEQVQNEIGIEETKRLSGVIRLALQSKNPSKDVHLLNTISQNYIHLNADRRGLEAQNSLSFLAKELPALKTQLEDSEKILNDFRNANGTIDIPAEIKSLIEQATDIEKTKSELELKQREYKTYYQSEYPMIKNIAAQLDGLKKRADFVNYKIESLPHIQQEYVRKARDVEVNAELYKNLMYNAQQLKIAQAGTIASAYVIDPAVIPVKPVKSRYYYIIASTLIGLIAGAILCQVLAYFLGIIRDPKKVEAELNVPILGLIPVSKEQMQQDGLKAKSKNEPAYLLAKEKSASETTEALRGLRSSLLFALSEKPNAKVVLITSAVQSQGKSLVASNLAYLVASIGKKVLLIESDVRRSSLQYYFAFNKNNPGLSGYLLGSASVDEVVQKNIYPNLDLLAAGKPIDNPGDLFSSSRMTDLINNLSQYYEYVIVDSPPVIPINDARSFVNAVDMTLFIVRQELVSLGEVQDSVNSFDRVGKSVDFIIYNGYRDSLFHRGYMSNYVYNRSKYNNYY